MASCDVACTTWQALIGGIKQERFQLDTAAARINLPGLIDGLVGMKPGETKTFPLTMPKDWPQAGTTLITCTQPALNRLTNPRDCMSVHFHSTDVESPPPSPHVCTSIHSEGQSCSDLGSNACSD